jgi:RHS repeat-associated protein
LTEDILRDVYLDPTNSSAPSVPPYLRPEGVTSWPAEYPQEFQTETPPLAGYVFADGSDHRTRGYFAQASRVAFDFHDPNPDVPHRGLPMTIRDPLENDTTTAYDRPYHLLPMQVTDAVGLTVIADYDYRVLQPRMVTDANGNRSVVTFSLLGFVTGTAVMGKEGEQVGDTLETPGTRMDYDFFAYEHTRDDLQPQPVFVKSVVREHHVTETDVPPAERDNTITSVQFSDGFGRLLQTRTQAEDVLFGNPIFGGGVLSPDQSIATGDTVGRRRAAGEPPNVIVSGWQVYDNKGRVVEKYEPFFSVGFDYAQPSDAEMGQKATMFYDPRGQVIRTLNPDGSEQRVIYGVPADLTNPDQFAPTPWEAFTYDANDLAPLSTGPGGTSLTEAAPASHHFTPSSIVIDGLGRTIEAIARNGSNPAVDWYHTRSTYDIRGNLLSVTDARDRIAFRYTYDLADRPWRNDSIDAGLRRMVLNVLGNEIERRDSKGALILQTHDRLQRPIRLWGRDDADGPVTLRQRLEYGDAGPDRDAMRARNLLSQLLRHHDEAGLTELAEIDFKGNVLDKSRRVIADAPILAVFAEAPANGWNITPFQVHWEPRPGQTLADRECEFLESEAHRTTSSFDALGRIKQLHFPQDVEGNRRELRPIYNNAGGLEKVFLDDTLYVERIAYDAKGQRALIAYGNGVMTRYAYDPRTFRLKRLRSERYTKPNELTYRPAGDALQDYGYDYDLAGNILVIRDRAPGSGILNNPEAATTGDPVLAQLLIKGNALNRRFNYDPVYRLLSATGRECDRPPEGEPWDDQPRCTDLTKARAYTEKYLYDRMGNILRLEHGNGAGGFTREFTVKTANNQLREVTIAETTYAYKFDNNGNMESEATSRHFDWNHADQMKVFRTQTDDAEPSVHAHYLYNAAGHRVKKLVRKQGGQVEVTHYIDGAFEHHRWGSGAQAGANNHVHVMDNTQRVALVRLGDAHPDDRGPVVQYQLGDYLGSSDVTVDFSGDWINREEFTPYGETSFGGYARKRYRFAAMERDEESGLILCGSRYLVPFAARWINCDPAGPIDDSNLYRYSRSNPLSFIDVSGLDSQIINGVGEGPNNEPGAELANDNPNFFSNEQGQWFFDDATGAWLKWQGGGWYQDPSQYFFVNDTAPAAPENRSWFDKALDFDRGIGKSVWNLAAGIYNIGRHPIRTGEGLFYVATNPIQSAKAIGRAVKGRVNAILSGDLEAAGETSGDLVTIFFAPEAEAAEIAKQVDVATDIAKATKAARAPILADTTLLDYAFKGHANALAEIRGGTTYVTSVQRTEFLTVEEFSARSSFLHNEGIITYQSPNKWFLTESGDKTWTVIDDVVSSFRYSKKLSNGANDAIYAGVSVASGIEAVTLDNKLVEFFKSARQGKYGVNIRPPR